MQITLAAARVNAGYKQEEVAKILNVSKSTIIKWEKGRTEPAIGYCKKMSELYNIPIDNIFFAHNSTFR